MSRTRILKLMRNLEKNMSLEKRYQWIAESFSSCPSLKEYMNGMYCAEDISRSDFYYHQAIYKELAEKHKFEYEKFRDAAFECHFRVILALEVNIWLEDYIEEIVKDYLQHKVLFSLLQSEEVDPAMDSPEDLKGIHVDRYDQIILIYVHYEAILSPFIDALGGVLSFFKREYFEECEFLFSGVVDGLAGACNRLELFKNTLEDKIREVVPGPEWFADDDRVLINQKEISDRWVSLARTASKSLIYGDSEDLIEFHRKSVINS